MSLNDINEAIECFEADRQQRKEDAALYDENRKLTAERDEATAQANALRAFNEQLQRKLDAANDKLDEHCKGAFKMGEIMGAKMVELARANAKLKRVRDLLKDKALAQRRIAPTNDYWIKREAVDVYRAAILKELEAEGPDPEAKRRRDEVRPPIEPDEDGHCKRCGLAWPDECETLEPHVCPPGSFTRRRQNELR